MRRPTLGATFGCATRTTGFGDAAQDILAVLVADDAASLREDVRGAEFCFLVFSKLFFNGIHQAALVEGVIVRALF